MYYWKRREDGHVSCFSFFILGKTRAPYNKNILKMHFGQLQQTVERIGSPVGTLKTFYKNYETREWALIVVQKWAIEGT